MANLIRRNDVREREVMPSQLEPLRLMRDLLNWDPFAEMMPSRLAEPVTFTPRFEVKETKDAYVFRADLPGVKEEDVDVTVTGTRLTVSGKREAEERRQDDRYYAYERSYGSFTRAFTLPDGVDTEHVEASLDGGVLTVRVGKRPEDQPRKISLAKSLGDKIKDALGKGDKANA